MLIDLTQERVEFDGSAGPGLLVIRGLDSDIWEATLYDGTDAPLHPNGRLDLDRSFLDARSAIVEWRLQKYGLYHAETTVRLSPPIDAAEGRRCCHYRTCNITFLEANGGSLALSPTPVWEVALSVWDYAGNPEGDFYETVLKFTDFDPSLRESTPLGDKSKVVVPTSWERISAEVEV